MLLTTNRKCLLIEQSLRLISESETDELSDQFSDFPVTTFKIFKSISLKKSIVEFVFGTVLAYRIKIYSCA